MIRVFKVLAYNLVKNKPFYGVEWKMKYLEHHIHQVMVFDKLASATISYLMDTLLRFLFTIAIASPLLSFVLQPFPKQHRRQTEGPTRLEGWHWLRVLLVPMKLAARWDLHARGCLHNIRTRWSWRSRYRTSVRHDCSSASHSRTWPFLAHALNDLPEHSKHDIGFFDVLFNTGLAPSEVEGVVGFAIFKFRPDLSNPITWSVVVRFIEGAYVFMS